MGDTEFLQFLANGLRSKSNTASLQQAAQHFRDAALHLRLLDSRCQDADAVVQQLSSKALSLSQGNSDAQKRAGFSMLADFAGHGPRSLFLENFPSWAAEALSAIKSPSGDDAVTQQTRLAAWKLLHAVFERLQTLVAVPGARRDGAPLVSKLVNALTLTASVAKEKETKNGRPGRGGTGEHNQRLESRVQPREVQSTPPALPVEAFQTLRAGLIAVPASFRHHIGTLEPLVTTALLLSEDMNAIHAAGDCFAALPRANGDGESWINAAQSLLATAHWLLDQTYLGMELPRLVECCRASIDPAAKILSFSFAAGEPAEAPRQPRSATAAAPAQPPAGGLLSSKQYAALFRQLHAVFYTLTTLLTASYPSPVPLPSHGVFMLAARTLSMDADVALSCGQRNASTGRLFELCVSLPRAHLQALRLVQTLLHVGGVACMLLYGDIGRLLSEHLERVAASHGGISNVDQGHHGGEPRAPSEQSEDTARTAVHVRRALYRTTSVYLTAGGIAAVRRLAPSVLRCVQAEMYHDVASSTVQHHLHQRGTKEASMHMASMMRSGKEQGPAKKKARRDIVTPGRSKIDYDANTMYASATTSIGTLAAMEDVCYGQPASLGMLAALLTSGGAVLHPSQRSQADDIAAHAAVMADAIATKLSHDSDGDVQRYTSLQLAARRALLASVLSPARHRPAHASMALMLFRNGLSSQHGALSAFCAHALACCEAFLHPRSSPVADPLRPVRMLNDEKSAVVEEVDEEGVLTWPMPRFWTPFSSQAPSSIRNVPQTTSDVEKRLAKHAPGGKGPETVDMRAPVQLPEARPMEASYPLATHQETYGNMEDVVLGSEGDGVGEATALAPQSAAADMANAAAPNHENNQRQGNPSPKPFHQPFTAQETAMEGVTDLARPQSQAEKQVNMHEAVMQVGEAAAVQRKAAASGKDMATWHEDGVEPPSDSEGSLPEIDSGASSSSEDDE